jgi:hypothetical protein
MTGQGGNERGLKDLRQWLKNRRTRVHGLELSVCTMFGHISLTFADGFAKENSPQNMPNLEGL